MCFRLPNFFTATHFHLGGRQLLTATITITFSRFSSNETRLLYILSLASALSLLSTSVKTLKFSRKKRTQLCCYFFSSRMGGHAIYRQNTQVFEMRNFTSAYTKGWTNGRTDLRKILSEPKFLGIIGNKIFLFTHGAPLKTKKHPSYITEFKSPPRKLKPPFLV